MIWRFDQLMERVVLSQRFLEDRSERLCYEQVNEQVPVTYLPVGTFW